MDELPEDRERRLMEEFRAINASADIAMYAFIAAMIAWSVLCFFIGWAIGGAV